MNYIYVRKSEILKKEIIENIKKLEKIEVDDELKEKLNKLVKWYSISF